MPWLGKHQSKRTPYTSTKVPHILYVLLVSLSPTFSLFHSTANQFELTSLDQFETNTPSHHKMTLDAWMVPLCLCALLMFLSLKFYSISLCHWLFSRYSPFETNTPNYPKVTLNTRSNGTYYVYTNVPRSQISLTVVVPPTVFELQAIQRHVH